MSHHAQGLGCQLCDEKLLTAHPDIVKIYKQLIKPKFEDCHISWAYRDKEDQEKAYAAHKSNAHYPMSPHNKMDDQGNPCSLALDLFRLVDNGTAIFPVRYYHDIAYFLEVEKQPIKWGATFSKISDFDHFELIVD